MSGHRLVDRRRFGYGRIDNRVITEHGADLGPYALAVYCALAVHADSDGGSFPGRKTIAKETGMSDRSVDKALVLLAERGLVIVENRYHDDGGKTSNRYVLAHVVHPHANDVRMGSEPDAHTHANEVRIEQDSQVTRLTEQRDVNVATRTHATRMTADWYPSVEDYAFGAECGFNDRDVDVMLAEFRDYWLGVPGQRGTKVDWSATFRNQIRRERDRRPKSNGAGTPAIPQKTNVIRNYWADQVAAEEAAMRGESASGDVIEGEYR